MSKKISAQFEFQGYSSLLGLENIALRSLRKKVGKAIGERGAYYMDVNTALYIIIIIIIISASLAIRIAEQSAYVTDHVVPRLSVRMYVLWQNG